jgi:ribonuclease VapC
MSCHSARLRRGGRWTPYLRYGKGRQHRAGLNFGDCCSYALAAETGLPLLFKGGDFGHTDIPKAL